MCKNVCCFCNVLGDSGIYDQGDTLDEIVETLEELIELIQDMIPEKVYEYVELAPNFTWCTMNVGADKVTETGDFFALAETETKEVYSRDTWKWVGNTDRYYAPNGVDDFLKAEDDAATVNWGAKYRTPTRAEWEALRNKDNFTWTYTDSYKGSGVAGDIVTSKVPGYEGKSIFLPHTGHYGPNGYSNYTPNADVNPLPAGCYWTSTVTLWSRAKWMGDALFCWNFTNPYQMGSYDAYYGMAVRAIYDDGNFECPADPEPVTEINGFEFVDMGNGLVWATSNVGAETPEEFGDYFAWGETQPKYSYGYGNYAFSAIPASETDPNNNGMNYIAKYTVEDGRTQGIWYDDEGVFQGDGKTRLELADDAAHVNMGGTWRIPTKAEWDVLYTEDYTWEWIDTDVPYTWGNVSGWKVTCIIEGDCFGNYIFLPAAGWGQADADPSMFAVPGWYGYWSSDMNYEPDNMDGNHFGTVHAWSGLFNLQTPEHTPHGGTAMRSRGHSIRAVSVPPTE